MKNLGRTFWFGAALAASSIVSNAWADGDDLDYARALARNGFVEMATEVCERLEKDPKASAEDKAGTQLIQAEILAKTATLKGTVKEKQAEVDKAIAILRKFIKDTPAHPRVPEAKFTVGTLLRQKGEWLGEELKQAAAPAAKAQVRADADKCFKEAEEHFAGLIEEFRSRLAGVAANPKQALEMENLEYNLMDAMFNVPRTQYSHCRLFESGDQLKSDLGKKAIKGFMDFELDYGDRMKAYESAIFWGLTHKELGEFKEAHERFNFAISLKTLIEGQLPDEARDIILTAVCQKAQAYNEEKKYAEAIKTVDDMVAMLKEAAFHERLGIAALLVKWEALMALGDGGGAGKLGVDLLKNAPTAGLKALIRARLAAGGNLGGRDGYEAAMNRNDLNGAIRALQGAITAAERDERAQPIPDLLQKLAGVYERLERWYDAAICYERIAKDAVEAKRSGASPFEEADKCAYLAALNWQKIASRSGIANSWEKEQVTLCLQLLTTHWRASLYSRNVQYLVADAAFEKGNYEEAAKLYLKVPEDALYYERALVMAGKAYFDLARQEWTAGKKDDAVKKKFDAAEASLEKYLAYAKAHEPDTEARGTDRVSVQTFCRQLLANLLMHEAKKKYAEAIKVLDEIDGDDASNDVRKRAWRQKVTAFLESGEVDRAIETTDKLLSDFRNAKETIESCQLVATRCDEAATELAGENPKPGAVPEKALALWERAARYYANWIQGTANAGMRLDPTDALQVADRIYGLGLLINDIDPGKSFTSYDLASLKNARIFQDAARSYEPIANERHPGIDTGRILLKVARCHDLAQDWERARDSYEQLFEVERLRNGKSLNPAVLRQKPDLFLAYEELGHVYVRLARKGDNRRPTQDEALDIFSIVVSRAEKDSRGWWQAKFHVIEILSERGGQNDFEFALLGIKDMRANYPLWDDDKFGMKKDWDSLEKAILAKAPRR